MVESHDECWMALDGQGVYCLYVSWGADFRQVAKRIRRMAGGTLGVVIMLAAFSWGCGRGVKLLARYLGEMGYRIAVAVMVDPIRWGWVKSLALSRWLQPRVPVPENIDRVYWFRQIKSRPASPGLLASEGTVVVDCGIVDATHEWVDNDERVKRFIREKALELFGKPRSGGEG